MSAAIIRQATENDLNSLVRMYQSTQRWLAGKGSDQWAKNTEEKVRTNIACSIERGECYVAEEEGRLIGTITVDRFADPEFWQSDDRPDEALYLHRMVVDRSAAGKNLGAELIDQAERIAASQGKRLLRLDA